MSTDTIKINVPVLARVEGEGALELCIEKQQITDLKLRIFEPPRYFEKFLEGRNYYDVPDTVARICGICPVAYQMSAVHAMESIFDISITPWIRDMRRLMYCGEWLQSHSLHIHLLAAPDFLGFSSGIEMAETYGDEVRRGLKLQTLGNDLIAFFGARSVHPVGVRVGGFSKAPDKKQAADLLTRVVEAKQDAIDLIHWLDTLTLPEDNQDFISVALHHDHEYAFNEGRLISDHGLDIEISEFDQHFKEHHVDHSTALYCLLEGKPYLVGPLARINLNQNQLPDAVKTLMENLKTTFPSKNMFHSMIARAIEMYFAILEAEKLLSHYSVPKNAYIEFVPRAGTGFGCTEAPRGFLWHRYDMDDAGCVTKAVIVPPTSQNQSRIEEDLKNSLINFGLHQQKDALQLHAEKVIRNYDPCISCATHFLDLTLIRDGQIRDGMQDEHIQHNLPPADFSSVNLQQTAIIGIGSPHPGDDLGWLAIDSLKQNKHIQKRIKQGLSLHKLDRPGPSLINHLQHYKHVLIIDAIKPGTTDNEHLWLNANQLKSLNSTASSHLLGLAESLQLMHSLQLAHADIDVLGLSTHQPEQLCNLLASCFGY